jgi:uncharacterized protein
MRAHLLETLTGWLDSEPRPPQFLGGIRGVGKTALVKELARRSGRTLARVPLADRPQLQAAFKKGRPEQILRRIQAMHGIPKLDAGCLLLLDDLHAMPEAAACVPQLHRIRPELPLLCAGSPMRITRHCELGLMAPLSLPQHTLRPLSFTEYLEVTGEPRLRRAIDTWTLDDPPAERTHQRLMQALLTYCFVGGLPDAVRRYQAKRDPTAARSAHEQTQADLNSDVRGFGDARHLRAMASVLDLVLDHPTVRTLMFFGRDGSTDRAHFRTCILRLCRGGVLDPLVHTDVAAQPLDALRPGRDYTVLVPDIGLMTSKGDAHYLAGLLGERDERVRWVLWLNTHLAPQFAGQELRAALPLGQGLMFWRARDAAAAGDDGGGPADGVDFVLEAAGTRVPIQPCGNLGVRGEALTAFVAEKKVPLAVSLGDEPASMRTVRAKAARYRLLSLPLYLAGALPRILEQVLSA